MAALLRGVCVVIIIGSALLGNLVAATEPTPGAPLVNFQRQVRPILSENCFLCHGPDKGTRMADVRLDVREGAFAQRKNGTVIVPGKPDDSLLVKRVLSDDPAYRMPPAFSHKTLTAEQKEILRRWVEQGAPWKDHWAFVAPQRSPPPTVKDIHWARNSIDAFILAKLEATGLQPAPEADRRSLIRRVTLDLTGLPPSPAEVEAFVKDRSPQAYEKVVDRLLASPHYGEQRAHYWLDAARYADTQGLHIDNYREMWPYRDWVIQAFNRNLAFDQFTIDQIAGDLLPNATLDQKIASGFERCNVTTNEGGSIPAEVAAMYAKDRADTTGAVWMGLTVGCATCHDHKFDPIRQKDYYALTSFFRNTTQYPLDGNVPDTPPTVIVPSAADRERWQTLNAQRAKIESTLNTERDPSNSAFETWLRSPARRQLSSPFSSALTFDLTLSPEKGMEVVRDGHAEPLSLPNGVTLGDGPPGAGPALHFAKESSMTLPNVPGIDSDKPFTVSAWVWMPPTLQSYVFASQFDSKKEGDSEKEWGWVFEVISNNGEPAQPSIRLQSSDGKYISAQPAPDYGLKASTWYHLTFTYDGSRNRKGFSVYINGHLVPSYGTGEDLAPLERSVLSFSPLRLGNQGKQFFENGALAGFRVLNRRVDEQDAELLFAADAVRTAAGKDVPDLSEASRSALLSYYLSEVDPATKDAVAKLHAIDAERDQIASRGAITFVQQERTDQQPTAHVLYRGLYDQMREEVHPSVPAVLPPMPQSAPRNRLGLAQWLVDPSNPLTARVSVNRFWEEIFGTGIVKTAEDFGSQGEPPTHPELLDWLAVDFRESGWDVKKLMRLMVTSAAYRQSGDATPEKLEKDADNRLLSRGPRYRMDAEMVRDCALEASGLLVPQIGGASVKPYQPPNVWETVAMDSSNTRFYKQDTGGSLYRRSLYTFWKRSAPPASMDIFNAPSREVCIMRRERTNTPLQALVTMNDPQFVEAARVLAQNALLASRRNVDREVDYMTSRLIARTLETKERDVVMRSYRNYVAYYESAPTDAKSLIAVGESKADPNLPLPQLAALTMVANELMNLDEVLVK